MTQEMPDWQKNLPTECPKCHTEMYPEEYMGCPDPDGIICLNCMTMVDLKDR